MRHRDSIIAGVSLAKSASSVAAAAKSAAFAVRVRLDAAQPWSRISAFFDELLILAISLPRDSRSSSSSDQGKFKRHGQKKFSLSPPAQQYGDRHAKDDCNEAIPTQGAANHLATAYVKFEGKAASSTAATTSCGTSYSTKAQISAACTDNDACMGFTTDSSDDPKCLVISGSAVETLSSSSDSVYLKREDGRAGATFRFKGTEWGDCTNGEKEAVLTACESTAGVTKNLGMCSLLVAMTPDGYKQAC